MTSPSPQSSQKVNEFDLPPKFKVPSYTWGASFKDWYRHSWLGSYSDEEVEKKLLSLLPFYPESNGKCKAEIIDTEVGKNMKIHEFYINNTTSTKEPKDIVLVHGYAASLGLFIENFEDLALIPGVRLHVIDLPGFGFSSRVPFPKFSIETKEDIYKIEDWFIDRLEEWRKERNIKHFTLMGHSFGGYLSCAYALKFNREIEGSNLIDKMILISPVGLERNRFSLLKNNKLTEGAVSDKDRKEQNELPNQIDVKGPDGEMITVDPEVANQWKEVDEKVDKFLEKRSGRIFNSLWEKHMSPFSLIRNAGPIKSKWISNWTTFRFSYLYERDPSHFQILHDYIFRVFNGKGSGEYAITRVLAFPALPRLPLLDRCPQKFAAMNLPTLWLYGDKDWMDEKAGLQMVKEINTASGKDLASYGIIPDAGHHLYLDNPKSFAQQVFEFLGF